MKRRASISVYLDDLSKVLTRAGLEPGEITKISKSLVEKSMMRAIVKVSPSSYRKLAKMDMERVSTFNQILDAERMAIGHKTKRIYRNDRSYPTLSQVCANAVEFCEHFELDILEGFKKYLKIGLTKIGKNYAVNKFITYNEYIFSHYERQIIIITDQDSTRTSQIMDYYFKKASIQSSKAQSILKKSYHHDFIYCRELIESLGADYTDFLEYQFKSFEKMYDKAPEPYQLHSEDAAKRYAKVSRKTSDSDWRRRALQAKEKKKI